MAELFERFEARQRTSNTRRVLAWLAGSVVLHVAVTASIIYVPALREAFQIAQAFGGMEYADEDYELQDMGGGQVRFLRPDEMFQYPAGYFAKALPPASVQPLATPSPTPVATPAPTPKPTPKPTPAPMPSPGASPSASPAVESAETIAKTDEPKQAEPTPEGTPETPKIPRVNSKPFTDFFVKTKKSIDAGEIDLSVPMRVTAEADLQPDGTLKFRSLNVTPNTPKYQKLAGEFAQIISASRAFLYLEGAKSVRINGTLNASTVSATVSTAFESADAAKKKAGGYNLLLAVTRLGRAGKNEEPFLKNTRVKAVGRNIQVELSLPRNVAGEVIAKQMPKG